MLRSIAIVAGASFLALTSAASAADLMMSAPPSMPAAYAPDVHDWSGFYAGVHGGYGAGTLDWTGTYYDGSGNAGGSQSDSFDMSGWLAGAQAGANLQMGNFVLGLEGDVDWTNISGEGAVIDPSNAPYGSVPSANFDWLASIRGRAGFAMDNLLLYGTGGLAWGAGSFSITNLDGANDDRHADANASGWVAGVGAELAVSDNMSIRGEYTYTKLSMDEVDFGDVLPADHLGATADIAVNAVTLGVNFKF